MRAGPTGRRFRLQGNLFSHTPKDYADVFKHHKVIAAIQGLQGLLASVLPQNNPDRQTDRQTDRKAGRQGALVLIWPVGGGGGGVDMFTGAHI